MTPPTEPQLRALRSWRLWLMIVVAIGQGLQYAIRPEIPLAAQAYAPLRKFGEPGWAIIGAALMLIGLWLALAPEDAVWVGHVIGASLYLMLMLSSLAAGIAPFVLLLPAGLHLGEVRLRANQRGNSPRSDRRRGE